jgi:hypothetical protein
MKRLYFQMGLPHQIYRESRAYEPLIGRTAGPAGCENRSDIPRPGRILARWPNQIRSEIGQTGYKYTRPRNPGIRHNIKPRLFLPGHADRKPVNGMMESRGKLRRYRRDELIYIQGRMPKAAYVIVSGMVNRETTQNGEIVPQLTRALSENWLGPANVTSLITPYMHSAIVAETSEIPAVGVPDLASLRCNQEFARYLLQVVGREQLVSVAIAGCGYSPTFPRGQSAQIHNS